MALTDLVFLIAFTYALTLLLIYQKEKTLGNIIFIGLGVTTLLATEVSPAISMILIGIAVINFIYDFFTEVVKA